MKVLFFFALFIGLSYGFGQTNFPLETVLQKGHTDVIQAADFSPDNAFFISGGTDNVLILWSLRSGKQIRTFSGHTKPIRSVRFSPDGQTVLSVAADNKVILFEVATGKIMHRFSIPETALYNAFYSKNEQYIYALDNHDHVFVWDKKSGNLVDTFRKDYGAHDEGALIAPTEDKIMSVANNKQTHMIRLTTRDTLLTIPFDKIYSQSFSSDGRYIAISSRKLFASVFDTETGELVNTFQSGDERCDGCNTWHAFTPDGKQLLTVSSKVDAILWDVKSGKEIQRFKTQRERPRQLSISKDGSSFLIKYDKEVEVYALKTGGLKFKRENKIMGYYIVPLSANGNQIALPGENGTIEIWNVKNRKKTRTLSGYLNHIQDNGMNLSYSNWMDRGVVTYIRNKRRCLLSPDNKTILVAGVDTSAFLIDRATGKVKLVLDGHDQSVIALDFSPDGKQIATAGGDRRIRIWDTKTGALLQTLKGHYETVFDVKFSADGQTLLSGAWDGTLRLWDLSTGNYRYAELNNNSPYSVGFTPNQLYVVTTDLENNVQFWERDALKPFRTLVGHTEIAADFDFSPDGNSVATACWDGKVKVWDVLTGMLVSRSQAHNGQVYAVKYDPLNRFVASAGGDNKIVLWNPQNGKTLASLTGHATSITDIDISKDGKQLISISADGVVKVWDLEDNTEIYSRIQMSKDEWLATTPGGHFDGSAGALKWVNYVKGLQVMNISSLFDRFYTPGLIEQAYKGELLHNDRGEVLNENLPQQLDVELKLGISDTRTVDWPRDSVYQSPEARVPVEISVNKGKEGAEEIRIYTNGKLVINESLENTISFRGGGGKHRFEVPLANGVNQIEAIVVSADRTESEPAGIKVYFDAEKAETDLFILSIGINKYENPAYNLNYAVNDVKAFVKSLKRGTDSLFHSVVTYQLTNDEAVKPTILEKIAEINEQVGPEDVFLFYYAGHGVMSEPDPQGSPEFFIVTHNVTNLYGGTEMLRKKAISATELMQFSMDIKAEKQLFILDACHSGGALNTLATRGAQREKALAQLARNTGTFFLTASQDAEFANESGQLNHGLFTYAMLEILQGDKNNLSDDLITVTELKSYVEERVPELSQEYRGTPQYPTGYGFGRDFPIVILK